MNLDTWNSILDRTAKWPELIDFLTFAQTTLSNQFDTLQLLVFADLVNYSMIHSAAEDPVDDIYYSYLKYFFWDFVHDNDVT